VTLSKSKPVLKLENVTKAFPRYTKPVDRLLARLFGKSYPQKTVLDTISFSLERGESLAILGRNGAGKSTLLKLIAGVLVADKGNIHKQGRINGLLELGTGFDENLSGRDNIAINGQLLGMTQAEIKAKQAAIIAYAELGDYIDQAVKTYSSGMVMRLGFAIAIHSEPICFIVDEALAVGDIRFQQKCIRSLKDFQQAGGSLLLVSHDLSQVKTLCQRAMILEQGRIAYLGEAREACNRFQVAMLQSSSTTLGDDVRKTDRQVSLLKAQWLDSKTQLEQRVLQGGDWVILRVSIDVHQAIEALSLGFMIRNRLGVDLFGTNTHQQEQLLNFKQIGKYTIDFPIQLNLGAGEYTLFLALHDQDDYQTRVQFWEPAYGRFQVILADKKNVGVVHCETQAPQICLQPNG